MAKNKTKTKNNAPLSSEEVANYKPEDPLDKLNLIMGVDLGAIFDQGVASGVSVVKSSIDSSKNMSNNLIPKPQKTTRKKKND